MAEPTVRVSGIVLSSLMFQHGNTDSDAEGLVLGESRVEEQITISDSQADRIHIQEIYYVQKHIACSKLNHLYSGAGEVNSVAVKKLLADNKQDSVLGWYRQRRNSDQQLSFRERIVHQSLKASLRNPHLLFLLLTPHRASSAESTHRTEYCAYISRNSVFLSVPLLVNNLGLQEPQSYWKLPAGRSSERYSATIRRHSSSFFSSDGQLRDVNDVNAMNDALQEELQAACREVEDSERQLETLQSEVSALRKRSRERRKMKKSEAAGRTGEEEEDQRRNLRLQEAVGALFKRSPLFLTHTLTLQGFPVPERTFSGEEEEEEEEEAVCEEEEEEEAVCEEETRENTHSRKRSREMAASSERKRRKSES
ncbi:BRCA1-A complex subunit Abraxas 1 isoform X2 [Gymnodraco acuticeps]|uniref:BRCA1-A complex subunit Abraxas 1 isoform X2 n=1 Tax=Gymnodraco acuticeps TaxID=8218 RepID=A0A6P8W2U8_GYMAC|nr:BRCA1-A complex subunit Abraxas 1 isoform X2 [Gymnodraco acuticeps]